jgi:hypothetical protein
MWKMDLVHKTNQEINSKLSSRQGLVRQYTFLLHFSGGLKQIDKKKDTAFFLTPQFTAYIISLDRFLFKPCKLQANKI